jgi:hypothetical protein
MASNAGCSGDRVHAQPLLLRGGVTGVDYMEKLSKIFLVIAYGIACLLVGWTLNGRYGVEKQVSDHIPTIEQIQLLVGAEPDGKLGPETISKWKLAVNDQYARPYFVGQR